MSTADDAIKAVPLPNPLERLLGRDLPTLIYHLRAATAEEVDAAENAVAEAKADQEIAGFRRDDRADEAEAEAAERVKAAQEALAACYVPVKVRALPPQEYEALVAKFADEKTEGGVDNKALSRAAFLACVQGGLTEAQWDEILAKCSTGERVELYGYALAVNIRTTGGAIPKG